MAEAASASTEGTPFEMDGEVTLTMTPSAAGWNYACVDDPALGQLELIACIRSDGQEIPLSNVWTSWATMYDDGAPVHENKLHIVDTLGSEVMATYQLVYANDVFSNIMVSVNPINCGQATGAGYYMRGDTVVLTATPSFGYEFDNWTEGGNVIGTDTVISFVAGANRNIKANFFLSTNTTQLIHLNEGWNWFSSYITYNEESLPFIEGQIGDNANEAMIKSMSSFVTLENSTWDGTLIAMANEDMYLMMVDQEVEFTLEGTIVRPSLFPIELAPGWTWLCYISNREQTLEQSLSSLTPNEGDIIKGQSGFSTYNSGVWVGSLSTLHPGKGIFLNYRIIIQFKMD